MVRGNLRTHENACLISLHFRASTEYRAKSDCKVLHKTPNNGVLLFLATKRLKRNLAKQQGVKSKKLQRLFCRLPFHTSVLSMFDSQGLNIFITFAPFRARQVLFALLGPFHILSNVFTVGTNFPINVLIVFSL